MSTGAYISAVAHAAFILFLLFGGIFQRDDLPEVSVADVSVITEEEFAALSRPETAPDVASDAVEPVQPEIEDAPELATPSDAAPATPEPEQPAAPETNDAAAEPLPQPLPAPDAEVSDSVQDVEAPPIEDDRPEAPEEAAPAPAPRVAPEPAAPAPPQAEQAPEMVEDTTPDPAAEDPAPEEVAAAPPEAAPEIVTEAEETKELAPAASPRPKARPNRPAQTQTAETEPEPEPAPEADPVESALAAALASEPAPVPSAAPSGPPLSGGERDALRVAVQNCWSVDVGSQSANVTVTVGVSMNRDGTVVGGQVTLVSATGGDDTAQRTAFEKARRAILRCQKGGFPLPPEKYDHWRDIEMTFNPDGMRLK